MTHALHLLKLLRPWGLCLFGALSQVQLPASAQFFAQNTQPNSIVEQADSYRLTDAIRKLRDRYHVNILFEERVLRSLYVPASAIQPRATLEASLNALLQPLGLRYQRVKNNYVILTGENDRKQQTVLPGGSVRTTSPAEPITEALPTVTQSINNGSYQSGKPQDRTITGRVTSETGEGLPGVSVLVKNTNRGATTDAEGRYRLPVSETGNVTLMISYVGYISQEVALGNRSVVNIQLAPDDKTLNEVVVVGYGTQNRRDVTGSIVSIAGKQLEDQRITSLEQGLQGQVAGVQVVQNTGAPGGSVSVRVRGMASIGSGTEPLYVIDGFPIANDGGSINIGSGPSTAPPNPLSSLNPNDIENIEILKDASATAIYGSRGANGVVLITTKRGKAGQSKIEFSLSAGVQTPVRITEMMNAREFAQMYIETRNFAFLDGGGDQTIPMTDARRGANRVGGFLMKQDSIGIGTNWMREVLRSAPMQNYQVTASGGTQSLRYAVTASYLNQEGTLLGSAFKRYAFRSNIEAQLNKRMTLGINIAPSYSINDMVRAEGHYAQGGVLGQAAVAAPLAPVYNSDGGFTRQRDFMDAYSARDLGIASYSSGINDLDNPVASALQQDFTIRQARVLANAYIDFELVKHLTFRTSLGVDGSWARQYQFRGRDVRTFSPLSGQLFSSQTINWLNENTLTYQNLFAKDHQLQAVVGYTMQANELQRTNVTATNINPSVPYIGTGQIGSGSDLIEEWRLLSFLSRVDYSYKSRYLLTATFRTDGSSRFGANNRFGYFPSVALGWRMGDEPFIKAALPIISDWKWRASIGISGNNNIGNYSSIGLLTPVQYPLSNQLNNGLALTTLDSPNLTWETTLQRNIGADVGLFNNRLVFTADYYNNSTSNLLWPVAISAISGLATTGSATVLRNIGEVENKGFEFSVNSQNLTGALKWSTNANIAFNRNKVLALGSEGERVFRGSNIVAGFQVSEVGLPTSQFFMLQQTGIFRNQAEVDAYVAVQGDGKSLPITINNSRPRPGDERYADINNDGKIDAADRVIVGNPHPRFTFGFTNNFSYKAFTLNILISGVYGNDIYNIGNRFITYLNGNLNSTKAAFDGRWISPEQPGNGYPRARGANNGQVSDFYLEDGSFARLRNLTLSYNLPNTVARRVGMQSARVYFSGQNLFTLTRYKGMDPEVTENGSNALSFGVDAFGYPNPRVLSLGLNVSF